MSTVSHDVVVTAAAPDKSGKVITMRFNQVDLMLRRKVPKMPEDWAQEVEEEALIRMANYLAWEFMTVEPLRHIKVTRLA